MNHFHPHSPEIKYVQDDVNTCCFGNFVSDMFDVKEHFSKQDIVLILKPSLLC